MALEGWFKMSDAKAMALAWMGELCASDKDGGTHRLAYDEKDTDGCDCLEALTRVIERAQQTSGNEDARDAVVEAAKRWCKRTMESDAAPLLERQELKDAVGTLLELEKQDA